MNVNLTAKLSKATLKYIEQPSSLSLTVQFLPNLVETGDLAIEDKFNGC